LSISAQLAKYEKQTDLLDDVTEESICRSIGEFKNSTSLLSFIETLDFKVITLRTANLCIEALFELVKNETYMILNLQLT